MATRLQRVHQNCDTEMHRVKMQVSTSLGLQVKYTKKYKKLEADNEKKAVRFKFKTTVALQQKSRFTLRRSDSSVTV